MTTEAPPPNEHEPSPDKTARRLVVVFIVLLVLGVASLVVLPGLGVRFPPGILLAIFGVIAVASILASAGSRDPEDDEDDGPPPDEGRPITCPGPRPPRSFRR